MATLPEYTVGALSWQLYAQGATDVIAAYVVDLVNYSVWRFTPSAVVPGTTTGTRYADGVVVDNMDGIADVYVQVGLIITKVPRFQKTVIPLGKGATNVTIIGDGASPRTYFYAGTFHGQTDNVSFYLSQVTASMNTLISGTVDAYLQTIRWKFNYQLASGFNLDNLTDSGFYDVLNPTNSGSPLPAGTWQITNRTYSQSNLYQRQTAENMLDPSRPIYTRANTPLGWTEWAIQWAGAAPLRSVPGTNTTLTAVDFDAPVNFTGSPIITVASLPTFNFRTGAITNKNPVTGTGTVKVPAGATLDGVVDGTVLLFPGQSAQIQQTGPSAYISRFLIRRPLISVPFGAAVASWIFSLPDAYLRFIFHFARLRPSANNGQLFAQISGDGGQNYITGASQYANSYIQQQGSGIYGQQIAGGSMNVTGGIALGYNPGSAEFVFDPNQAGERQNYQSFTTYTDSSPSTSTLLYSGNCNALATRPNAIKFLWANGSTTGFGAVTMEMIP